MHSRHLLSDALLWMGVMLIFTVPLSVGSSPTAMLHPGFWPSSILRSSLVLVLIRVRSGRTPRSSWGVGRGVLGVAALVLLLVAAALTVDALLGALGPSSQAAAETVRRNSTQGWLLWALAVPGLSLAALAEERFFRELNLELMDHGGVPVPVAVLASAVVFGIGHLFGGIPTVVFAVVAGVLLGLTYLRAASVVPGAVAHSIYNLLLLLSLASGTPAGPA